MATEKSGAVLIKEYFFPGEKASDVMAELRQLTPEDKEQLTEGLRNGSLTY